MRENFEKQSRASRGGGSGGEPAARGAPDDADGRESRACPRRRRRAREERTRAPSPGPRAKLLTANSHFVRDSCPPRWWASSRSERGVKWRRVPVRLSLSRSFARVRSVALCRGLARRRLRGGADASSRVLVKGAAINRSPNRVGAERWRFDRRNDGRTDACDSAERRMRRRRRRDRRRSRRRPGGPLHVSPRVRLPVPGTRDSWRPTRRVVLLEQRYATGGGRRVAASAT